MTCVDRARHSSQSHACAGRSSFSKKRPALHKVCQCSEIGHADCTPAAHYGKSTCTLGQRHPPTYAAVAAARCGDRGYADCQQDHGVRMMSSKGTRRPRSAQCINASGNLTTQPGIASAPSGRAEVLARGALANAGSHCHHARSLQSSW